MSNNIGDMPLENFGKKKEQRYHTVTIAGNIHIKSLCKISTGLLFCTFCTVEHHYKGGDQTTLMRLLVCVAVVRIPNIGGKKVNNRV